MALEVSNISKIEEEVREVRRPRSGTSRAFQFFYLFYLKKTAECTALKPSKLRRFSGRIKDRLSDQERLRKTLTMAEKTKSMSHVKHVPKDAQVIMSIMKDMGISDYEPRVINQLLEFTYRYITCTLDDSKIYANHAKKKFIDLDDVRLAVKMQSERTFINPPPRDVLLDVARAKNNTPLPFVKPNNGLRLPPDRYCLNTTNYKLKPSLKKPIGKPIHSIVGNNMVGGQSRVKVDSNKGGLSIVKRPGTLTTVSRTQTISIPKPVFKFSTGTSGPVVPSTPTAKPKIQIASGQSTSFVKMETDESAKRKREEDDYDVP